MCVNMAKKVILLIVIAEIFFFGLLFTTPIFILSNTFSDYDLIDETISFCYAPSNSSSFDRLNIISDTENIKIVYVNPSLSYNVKIDVNIKLGGSELVGKSVSDFFNFTWLNSSNPVSFSIEHLSKSWFDTSTILTNDVSITVSIRKDMVLNINATIEEGIIEMTVPFGVTVRNVDFNVNTIGTLVYNFVSCQIEGRITGIVNEGILDLDLYNVKFSYNSNLSFTLGNGDIDMNIIQDANLNANVSGIFAINEGDVSLRYDDNTNIVGAKVEIPDTDNLNPEILCFGIYGGCPIVGFEVDEVNNIFTSSDLLAGICNFHYNLTYRIGEGIFSPHLTSF
jgi:hypothetical protein